MAENRKTGNNRLDPPDKGTSYFNQSFGIDKENIPIVTQGWEGYLLTIGEDNKISLTLDSGGASQIYYVIGAAGDGETDDTTALQESVDAVPEGCTLLLGPSKIYKIDQLNISKSINIIGNNSKILSTDNSEAHPIINVYESVNNFQISDTIVEYQGPFYNNISSLPSEQGPIPNYAYAAGPNVDGVYSNAFQNTFKNIEVYGCSVHGIRLFQSTSLNYIENVNAHNNGYAGFFSRSGKNTIIGGSFNDNGGNNAVDGYGVVVNNKYGSRFSGLNPEEESGIVMGVTANRNMSRGIDTHHGDDIIVSNNHCENNGCTSSYWNGNSTNAYQIQIVNDCTKVIVTDNICQASFNNVAVIKVGGTTGFKHGVKEAIITNNIIVTTTSSVGGIEFNPFMTTNAIISNNTIRHVLGGLDTEAFFSQSITMPSEISIGMGGITSTGSYVENLIISDNIVDGQINLQFRGNIPTSLYITGSSLTPNASSSRTGSLIISNNKTSKIIYNSFDFKSTNSSSLYINSCNNVINGFDYIIVGNGGEMFKSNNDTINSYLVNSGFNGSINTLSASADIINATIYNSFRAAIENSRSYPTNVINCKIIYPNRQNTSTNNIISYNGDCINNIIIGSGSGIGFIDRNFSIDHKLIGNSISSGSLSFGFRSDLTKFSGSSTLTYTTLPTIDLSNKFININDAVDDPDFLLEKGVIIPNNTPGNLDPYEYLSRIVTSVFPSTTISTLASAGDTTITVSNSTGYQTGGNIAILLNTNVYQWTTITAISGNIITINNALFQPANVGQNVVGYKTSKVGVIGLFESNNFTYNSFSNALQIVSNNHGIASGVNSFSQGSGSRASATGTHAQGFFTTASGLYSHAEGQYTRAEGAASHAEGEETFVSSSGLFAHAEGRRTTASGQYSHAEGWRSNARGNYSHASGIGTLASGFGSNAMGFETTSSGDYSNAMGEGTIASGSYQLVIGRFNELDTTSRFVIGAGTNNTNRRSAFKITSNNRAIFLTQSGNPISSPGSEGEFFLSGSAIYVYINNSWKSASLS